MTENTAPETNETVETETAVPALTEENLSEMAAMVLARVKPDYVRAEEIVAELSKADNYGQTLADAIENSKSKKVVELRQKVEEFNQFIIDARKSMEEIVKPSLNLPSEDDVTKLEAEYKEVSAGVASYADVFERETGQPVSVLLGNFPGKKRSTKAGQGEGISRPRVQSIEITTDLAGEQGWKKVENKEGKSTFSVLAQFIKSATDGKVDLGATDYSDAWDEQNGGKGWQNINDLSTFTVSASGGDKTYQWHVRVTK